jgi:hypothetical protein
VTSKIFPRYDLENTFYSKVTFWDLLWRAAESNFETDTKFLVLFRKLSI